MKRAYFTARLNWRWWPAELPERLRENILPWLVQRRDRVCVSFQSTYFIFQRVNRHRPVPPCRSDGHLPGSGGLRALFLLQ